MMTQTSGKVQSGSFGPAHLQHCMAPVFGSSPTRSSPGGRLVRCGAIALIVGALVILCASIGAFYQWKVSDNNGRSVFWRKVHDVQYNMRINGEKKKGSMEIDSQNQNHLERFTTGSGEDEAVELHDFQSGTTALRFFRGEKCYIKPHIKASLPDLGAYTETLTFDLSEDTAPPRPDRDSVIWVAAEHPMQDTRFLSPQILALCGDAAVYWLHRAHPRDGGRRRRDTRRAARQLGAQEFEEAAAGQRTSRGGAAGRADLGAAAAGEEEGGGEVVGAVAPGEKEEGGDGGEDGQSAAGSAYNPENPYHRTPEEREAVPFDPMLDHLGICCSECRRGHTHCQRVCEPLGGYWPWPYHHAGCRVACRVIMPCRWWVARMLGVV